MSDWKEALAPTPECIDLARLTEEWSAAERAHLETCARCQAELALFREISREETSAGEAREVEWIAGELRRRNNVVAFRPKAWRVLYAVAAALVLAIGAGWWLQMREPSIDVPAGPDIYRSARLEIVSPSGDIAKAPDELHWKAVPHASLYRVRILEIDATQLWSGNTPGTHVALPPDVIARFAPGKTLRWEVEAFRGKESLAVSQTQTVRVVP